MENLLIKYMSERVKPAARTITEPGPVITISRECGCSGQLLAETLTKRINSKIDDPAKSWKWVSKEILNLASEELRIHPNQINDLLKADAKNFLDELVFSFTDKYYIHDTRIKKVIEDVVRNIAVQGRVVIVGRGSEALTIDNPRSLHVKLTAPLSWKIGVICDRRKISYPEAKKFVIEVDKQRSKFRNDYLDKNRDAVLYDIEFNAEKFTIDEISDVIMKIAEIKSLF